MRTREACLDMPPFIGGPKCGCSWSKARLWVDQPSKVCSLRFALRSGLTVNGQARPTSRCILFFWRFCPSERIGPPYTPLATQKSSSSSRADIFIWRPSDLDRAGAIFWGMPTAFKPIRIRGKSTARFPVESRCRLRSLENYVSMLRCGGARQSLPSRSERRGPRGKRVRARTA